MNEKPLKLVRVTTVDMSLFTLLEGQMRFMAERGIAVKMISANTGLVQKVVEREGCEHLEIPMARQISPIQDLRCLILMVKTLRKIKPDIVHSHTSKGGLLGMLGAWLAGVPIRIQTVAGTPPDSDKGGLKRAIMFTTERLTFWAATDVWPNSFSLLDFVKKHRFTSEKKLFVIGKGSSNGIDLRKYRLENLDPARLAATKAKIQHDPRLKYLLFVGRLLPDKGIVELIEAFQKLRSEFPELRLVLVGPIEAHRGSLPDDILAEIKTGAGILHMGWSDEVEYFMAACDFFINPSHREGFPNTPLQAGALGTPNIASDCVGNVDVVRHLETGLLFEMKNAEKLADAVRFALKNGEKMAEMAAFWQKEIFENFDRPAVHRAIFEKYEQLVQLKLGRKIAAA